MRDPSADRRCDGRLSAEPIVGPGPRRVQVRPGGEAGDPVAAAAELPRLSVPTRCSCCWCSRPAPADRGGRPSRWAALLDRGSANARPREAHLMLSAACAIAGPSAPAGREALHSLASQRRLDWSAVRSMNRSRPSSSGLTRRTVAPSRASDPQRVRAENTSGFTSTNRTNERAAQRSPARRRALVPSST